MNKQLTPFHDIDGNLKFPYRLLRNQVFIFPTPPPAKVGEERLLYIPEQWKRNHQDKTGIVLAIGPGYQNDEGKWFRPSPELRPGVQVFFDNSVPWGHLITGLDGKKHYVFLCGVSDICGIAEEV